MTDSFSIQWVDGGRDPQCAPDPKYPNGKPLDASMGLKACSVPLPWPAKRCGLYVVTCKVCGYSIAVTTAGRPDDPCSVKIPCKDGAP